MPRTRTSRSSEKLAAKHVLWYVYSWSAQLSFLLLQVDVLVQTLIIYGDLLKKLAYKNYSF